MNTGLFHDLYSVTLPFQLHTHKHQKKKILSAQEDETTQ